MMYSKTFVCFVVVLMFSSQTKADDQRVERIASLGSHRFQQNCNIDELVFTPDGSRIVALGSDRAIVWDVANGKRSRLFNADGSRLGLVSKNGLRIVLSKNGMHTVYETRSGEKSWEYKSDSREYCIAISDDGERIALAELTEKEPSRISILDSNGKLIREFKCDSRIQSARFSPDGKRLVCAEAQGKRNLVYSFDDSAPLVLEGEAAWSASFDFSPDGNRIVGKSKTVVGNVTHSFLRIWDSLTGKVVGSTKGDFSSIRFSPDGRQLVASGAYSVTVFDVESVEKVHVLGDDAPRIGAIAFSPDGKVLATTQNTRIRLWNTETWEEISPGEGHVARTHLVEFSPDGKTIATAGRDQSVILWSWPAGKQLAVIPDLGQSSFGAISLSFSPDSKKLLVSAYAYGKGKSFFVYDLRTVTQSLNFGFDTAAGSCVFLPNGKEAVSADKEGSIAIWDIGSGEKLRTVGALESDRIQNLQPIDNGKSVWWAAGYQQMGIRDLETGKDDLRNLEGLTHHSDSNFALSPDAGWISIDGQVLDLETETLLLRDQETVNAISPDGQLLAIGKTIWEKSTRKIIHTFGNDDENEQIDCLTFSPDGTVLLSTGDPDTSVWDMTGLLDEETRTLPELNLTDEELDELWTMLGGENGWKAQQAAWKLAAGGAKAVEFLSRKIQPASAIAADELETLREQLSGEDLDARDMAARQLLDLGIVLTPAEVKLLRRRVDETRIPANASSIDDAIAKGYDPENFLQPPPVLLPLPKRVQESRAVAALERCTNPASAVVLGSLAKGRPDSPLTKEAQSSLKRVKR